MRNSGTFCCSRTVGWLKSGISLLWPQDNMQVPVRTRVPSYSTTRSMYYTHSMRLKYVCVFFTLNRSSTRRHPVHPVSVLILHPRKISSVVTSYDTEIVHRNAFDNAMSCPSTGYDRHNIHTSATEIHWKREIRKKRKQKQKQKQNNNKKTNKNNDKNKTKNYIVPVSA